jgi:urease accessory protein
MAGAVVHDTMFPPMRASPVISTAADVISPPVKPAAGPGCGSITVVAHGGRSRVTRAFAASPLRLLTPRNHGPASWIYTSTFGGGLVGGDAFDLDLTIGDGATVYLSTQAATKVYRSSAPTSVEVRACVGREATLMVVPDPVICFAGSSFRQVQRFELHDEASLVFVDWLSSGRHASGERWQFDRYDSRVFIDRGRRRIVHDGLLLSPEHGPVADRLGRFESILVAVLLGPAVAQAAEAMVMHVGRLALRRRGELIVSASRVDGGCVCRIAATSVEETGWTLRALLGFVPSLLGDDPWARKY